MATEAVEAVVARCANCHRTQQPGEVPFRRCSKCVQEKLVAALYCSRECQKENWEAHKAWHNGMRALLADADAHPGAPRPAESDEYGGLLKEGLRECALGNASDGMKLFMRAILLRPEQPAGYANLGYALRDSGNFRAAVPQLLKAVQLFEEGSEQWGATSAVAWFSFANPGCEDLEVPSWMTTLSERICMAERCVKAAPQSMQAWAMLGMALGEEEADLGRASQALMRAAKLTDHAATKEGYLRFARAMLESMKQRQHEGSAS